MQARALKQPCVRVVEVYTDPEFRFRIWLDQCEGFPDNDLLLGVGETKTEAIQAARESLATAAKQLEHLENRG